MKSRLLVITNPSAGTMFFTPEHLINILDDHRLVYDQQEVSTPDEAYGAVINAPNNKYSAVVPFGGDGTVIAVVKAAIKKNLPILPLPGGSANLIAKHAGISPDIKKVIEAYASGLFITRSIPVASAGPELLVLEFHFGVISEAVRATPGKVKRWIGAKAYEFYTLLKLPGATRHAYELSLDGKDMHIEAYACFIVNIGHEDLLKAGILPRPKPGFVRVILIRRRNLLRLLQWYLFRRFASRNIDSVVSVRYAKQVIIKKAPAVMNYDDQERQISLPLTVKADDCLVSVIVPMVKTKKLTSFVTRLKNAFYRNTDQLLRHTTGIPSEKFSLIDKQLYLGGQYGTRGIKTFVDRGITGIVSMRMLKPEPIDPAIGIEILHLPTIDETAPTIESLKKGIAFIDKHISSGGSAYVHCRLGEGRGPTMAAAYLISKGMKVEDALAHLRHYRPFARPNKKQVVSLNQLAALLQLK